MNILHLTDLHFDQKNKFKIDRLFKELKSFTKEKGLKADILFFTGDLVFSGEKLTDFNEAYDNYLIDIANKLNIPPKNIIICPGNHDIYRNQEMKVITNSLFSIDSNKKIDDFLADDDQKIASLKNLDNYYKFITNKLSNETLDNNEINDFDHFYTIHTRTINNIEYNIVTLNTAWRCNDSNTDTGNLVIPISKIEELISKTSHLDNKILLHHHPFEDLKYFNKIEVKKLIYENFIVAFNGHTHNKENSILINKNDGIINITSEASFSNINSLEKIGFSLLEFKINDMKLSQTNYRFDDDIFYINNVIEEIIIPIESEKREILEFNNKIQTQFDNETLNKAKLFVTYEDDKNFYDLISSPNIKDISETSLKSITSKQKSNKVDINQIDPKLNIVLYGKDKYGKTIISNSYYLNHLKNFSKKHILPIFINKTCTEFNPISIIRDKYNCNKNNASEILKKFSIKIIIDDFDLLDDRIKTEIESYIDQNKENTSYFITVSESILSEFKELKIDSTTHVNLYIHDISENEIIQFTNKVFKNEDEKINDIVSKIKLTLKQLNIPYNYWTVSLFVWIFKANTQKQFNDNFELIELYIDNILNKEELIQDAKFKSSYEDLKSFLGFFAIKLIQEYEQNNYKIPYSELINLIVSYKEINPKFVVDERKLFNILTENFILKEDENDNYSFRLKGVFEYFIAYYLKDDKNTLNLIIENDSHYLSYANELELIAGFNKKDEQYIKNIFEKTKVFYNQVNEDYKKLGSIDKNLLVRSQSVNQKMSFIKQGLKNIIKAENIDTPKLINTSTFNSEIEVKKIQESIEINSDNLEKLLFILCRVYRNSNIQNTELTNEILDFILESSSNLCFYILDNDYREIEENNEFLKVFSNLIPLIIQTFLNEALSQLNLEDIFKNKIIELKQDKENNQLKLFVVYFLLIDLDLKSNKKYINEIIELSNNYVITNAITFKILSFLVFNKIISKNTADYLIESLKLNYRKTGLKEENITKNIELFRKDIIKHKILK